MHAPTRQRLGERALGALMPEQRRSVARVREIAKPIIRWQDSPQLGYEILPNKYFYRYQPPTPAKELLKEFWRLEKEAETLLEGLGK